MTFSGNVSLSSVTEAQLLRILQFKLAHEGQFQFDPTQAKLQQQTAHGGIYTLVNINWGNSTETMKLVLELLVSLQSS